MTLLESFEKWRCSRVCQVGEGRRGERGESKRTCSLWTIPWWWRQLTASRTERMTVVASFWVDSTFARIRSKALRRCQKRVVFYARLEALRDRRCWWGGRLCPDTDFVSFWGWRYNLVLTYCPINAEKACERSGCWNIDWGLRPREVVRKNHCFMSQWLCYAKVCRLKEKKWRLPWISKMWFIRYLASWRQ